MSSATASGTSGSSPFDHAALGQCFKGPDAFVQSTLGDAALTDPSIRRTSKGAWTWIVDQTASKNYTWYLLEAAGEKVCLRVFVPAASHVQFQGAGKAVRVEAFIAPEVAFSSKLVEFQPTSSGERFRAAHCYVLERSTSEQAAKRKPVSCDRVLE